MPNADHDRSVGTVARAIPRKGLPRRLRLTRARDFDSVFGGHTPPLGAATLLMWLRRGEGAALRLGVAAGRRQFRRAVDRNRARRLMREAYRLNRHRLTGDVDVVLVARVPILKSPLDAVERDLLRLCKRAGLLAPTSTPEPRSQSGAA